MPRASVLGLDVSANRVALAVSDGARFHDSSILLRKQFRDLPSFAREAAFEIGNRRQRLGIAAVCLEINLHPDVMYAGRQSPNKIAAYMRSRWVEGAIIAMCAEDEPGMIKRLKGGYWEIPTDRAWLALQASSGKNVKESRRRRMMQIYGFMIGGITQDEVDALAIAHECAIAINLGRGMAERRRAT